MGSHCGQADSFYVGITSRKNHSGSLGGGGWVDWAWKDGVGGRMDRWRMDGWMEGGMGGWKMEYGWRELGRGEWVEHRQMDESTTCLYIDLTDALVVRAT